MEQTLFTQLFRRLQQAWREDIARALKAIGAGGGSTIDGSHVVMAHADLVGVTSDQHHAAVTLGAGSDAALSLAGQVLTLADVLTPTEHDARDHTGVTGVPSIAGLLDETAHDARDHTGITGCGGGAALTVEEADGSPSVASVATIIVSNGKLTDNGAGSVTLDLSGDAGSPDAATVTYTPAVLADWDADTDPGNVDDALDQLASRVKDVEAVPPGSGVTVREQDGSPSVAATVIEFASGTTVADQGAGVVRVTPPAGGTGGGTDILQVQVFG